MTEEIASFVQLAAYVMIMFGVSMLLDPRNDDDDDSGRGGDYNF